MDTRSERRTLRPPVGGFRDDGNPNALARLTTGRRTLLATPGDYWAGKGPIPQRGGTGTWTNGLRPRVYGLAIGDDVVASPGQRLSLDQVQFLYSGPDRGLIIGFAAKPHTGWAGTNFNNGANVPSDLWSQGVVHVAASSAPRLTTVSPSGSITVPPAHSAHPLIGGGTGTINDQFDLWVWISDLALVEQDQDPAAVFKEAYFVHGGSATGSFSGIASSLAGSIPKVQIAG